MKDTFLCKARRIEDWEPTEWVQGHYVLLCNKSVIVQGREDGQEIVEIDPSTLCRCIGLRDENENLLWENDIVFLPSENRFFVIRWNQDAAKFYLESDTLLTFDFEDYRSSDLELVGNGFDNPSEGKRQKKSSKKRR